MILTIGIPCICNQSAQSAQIGSGQLSSTADANDSIAITSTGIAMITTADWPSRILLSYYDDILHMM